MSISFTNYNLGKLEQLLKDVGYKVRYEKGNFKTGYCLIERSKIIVVNKFSNLESKIVSLIELIKNIDIDISNISEKQKSFYYTLKQTEITF